MDQSNFLLSCMNNEYEKSVPCFSSEEPESVAGNSYVREENSSETSTKREVLIHPGLSHVTSEQFNPNPPQGQPAPLPYYSSSSTTNDEASRATYDASGQPYNLQILPSAQYGYYTPNNMMVVGGGDLSNVSQMYMLGAARGGASTAQLSRPLGAAPSRSFDTTIDTSFYEVKKCHLHTKPQLTCKFCRKFKSAIHQHARVVQQQKGRWAELQDLENTAWSTVEMTNPTTYNVSTLLRENILASEYFKSLYGLQTFKEVVDEIYNYADHAEPYCAGSSRAPSTLFCCLYKLFTMHLKEHEVQALLDHTDSPYLRCAGFLYLRFVLPPEKLWDWLSPYFLDDEVFSTGVDKTRTTTIGEYVESLVTEDRYFSIVLPRIPVKIKAQDGAQLITMPSHRKRKAQNKAKLDQFKPGIPVAVCSNGEWVEGRVLSIDGADTGQCSCLVQFEDDVVDLIDLGLVIILDAKIRALKRRDERRAKRISRGLPPFVKKRKHHKKNPGATHTSDRCPGSSRSRGETCGKDSDPISHRKGFVSTSPYTRGQESHSRKTRSCSLSPQRSFSGDSLNSRKPQTNVMEEFRKRERAKALASGKDYARRPTSYKSSLSLRFETSTGRKRSRSPPVVYHGSVSSKPSVSDHNASRKNNEQTLAHQQRMAQLVERYSRQTH